MKQDILTLLRTGHFNLANTGLEILLDNLESYDKLDKLNVSYF